MEGGNGDTTTAQFLIKNRLNLLYFARAHIRLVVLTLLLEIRWRAGNWQPTPIQNSGLKIGSVINASLVLTHLKKKSLDLTLFSHEFWVRMDSSNRWCNVGVHRDTHEFRLSRYRHDGVRHPRSHTQLAFWIQNGLNRQCFVNAHPIFKNRMLVIRQSCLLVSIFGSNIDSMMGVINVKLVSLQLSKSNPQLIMRCK